MYSITLRETGEPVVVYSQPDFSKQVETNRKVRELIGGKASGVLMVQVMTATFDIIRVDSKALMVRFYHTKDKSRLAMFAEAERLLFQMQFAQAEELFWTAITKVSLVDSGVVNEDGSLKPYSSFSAHGRRAQSLSAEEVDLGDCFIPF